MKRRGILHFSIAILAVGVIFFNIFFVFWIFISPRNDNVIQPAKEICPPLNEKVNDIFEEKRDEKVSDDRDDVTIFDGNSPNNNNNIGELLSVESIESKEDEFLREINYNSIKEGIYRTKIDPLYYFVSSSDSWQVRHVNTKGAYPDTMYIQGILETFKKNSSKELVFLDIGANVGVVSFVPCSEGIRTIAIEAFPNNVRLMKQGAYLNSFGEEILHPMNLGLSNKRGEMYIGVVTDNFHWTEVNGMMFSNIQQLKDYETKHKVKIKNDKVQVVTLDYLVYDMIVNETIHGVKSAKQIKMMKMDIEGFEPFVLQGGRRFIEEVKPTMFIEISFQMRLRAGSKKQEGIELEWMENLGYRFYKINHGLGGTQKVTRKKVSDRGGDFIFVHKNDEKEFLKVFKALNPKIKKRRGKENEDRLKSKEVEEEECREKLKKELRELEKCRKQPKKDIDKLEVENTTISDMPKLGNIKIN